MPRFENEGFNPEARKRNVDRTVPEEENYYGDFAIDLDFNNRENVVRDNQRQSGVNPCNSYNDINAPLEPPARSVRQQQFVSETPDDFRQAPQRSRSKPEKRPAQRDKHNGGSGKNGDSPIKKKLKKIIAIIIAVIILIVAIGIGTVSSIMNKITYNEKAENTYVAEDSLEHSSKVKNILLLGVDARAGENGDETRSDTMMLVSIDKKTNSIKLTSFLRDTWVYIPTMDCNQRLNAACSSGGYQGVVDAIEYNFGVDIDGYAVVDFEMFKVLVDSIGGVEVDVTEAEAKEVTSHPKRYGNVTLESGKYKLTGEQALAYCRIRKIDTDFVRTERQRTVMSAILKTAKSSNPLKLLHMASKSAPYIETDLTKGELKKMAMSAMGCLSGDIVQTKVPFSNTWDYATIYGNSVIAINVEKNKTKLIDYIYNQTPEEIKAEQSDK